jgi:tetratricopeptide (TPR) repeat protein
MRISTGKRIREERKKNKLTQSELAGDWVSVENLIQIEESRFIPSLITLTCIAKKLNVDVDYLMSEQSRVEQLAVIAKELLTEYKSDHFYNIIERLDELKVQSPMLFHNEFIEDIYISTYFKQGNYLTAEGRVDEAKLCYEQLLPYEQDFMLDNELTAYELYMKLADAYGRCQEIEKANLYNIKAKELIKKMMAAKEVQNLYLLMTGSDYQAVISAAKKVDSDMLDDYSKAKMNMVLGNANFNLKLYKTAINYLRRAIKYYEEKTYNSLTIMMYEELSKCYSNLDEHELAVEYMQKAKKSQEQRH